MAREKRPRDPNQLAAYTVGRLTGEIEAPPESVKDTSAAERGRLGGLKGGKARAAKMSGAQRSAAARKAVRARWRKISKR